MPIDLTENDSDGVLVAELAGRLDMAAAGDAESRLTKLISRGKPVLLDLSRLSYASSAGLRVLLVCAKAAKAAGLRFGLAAPQEAVKEILEMSGFPSIMGLHPTRAEGVAALK